MDLVETGKFVSYVLAVFALRRVMWGLDLLSAVMALSQKNPAIGVKWLAHAPSSLGVSTDARKLSSSYAILMLSSLQSTPFFFFFVFMKVFARSPLLFCLGIKYVSLVINPPLF